ANQEKKWESIVAEVVELNQLGRPVLIGTRSIDKSELLSEKLTAAGVEHQVLNARQSEDEATVIAAAGCAGRVTVATNMAGRGTDIALGEGVEALGGLHVVGTELHESARIDRQLIGRCGRQGDPGSFRQFMALDDEILQAGLGERSAAAAVAASESSSSSTDLWIRRFYRAQRKVEKSHFRQRRLLMHHERRRRELQRQMGQDPFLDASQ
ncbi:MAG: preprotein translocase subunit SecA, partial [Pirellulaceae bacterium]|nr:preprotein translocase subunit SecA [Pirellulaceae bacterium]